MTELSEAHVGSGRVMTVNGLIKSADLGVTLMHEHLQNDCSCWWNPPKKPERQHLAEGPVRIDILSELRQDPFVNKHNIALDELDLCIEEIGAFAKAGGRTVVDPTCRGIGRDPVKLRRIAAESGLNIVMGAGYYLASSMPEEVARLSVDDIADQIGEPLMQWHVGILDSYVATMAARLDDAERIANATLILGMQIGDPDAFGVFAGQFFFLATFAGRHGELLPIIQQMMSAASEPPLSAAKFQPVYSPTSTMPTPRAHTCAGPRTRERETLWGVEPAVVSFAMSVSSNPVLFLHGFNLAFAR